MTFHHFFHDLFKFSRFSCQFQKFKIFTCFRAFFDFKKLNRHKIWRSPKCMPFTLLKYSSPSYIVLAFQSSAVNNLSNRTLIFRDFQGPTIKYHNYPGLDMKFLNSMTFQVFHDLYEPWFVLHKSKSGALLTSKNRQFPKPASILSSSVQCRGETFVIICVVLTLRHYQ